jgi:hypothetical protein
MVQECIVCCRHAKFVMQCLTQAWLRSVTLKCVGPLGGPDAGLKWVKLVPGIEVLLGKKDRGLGGGS